MMARLRLRTSAKDNSAHVVARMTEFGECSHADLMSLGTTNTHTHYYQYISSNSTRKTSISLL